MRALIRNSFLIIFIFVMAFVVARSTQRFRGTDLKWIFQYGQMSCYFMHIIAFLFAIINIYFLVKSKVSFIVKLVFIAISSVPIIFIFYALLSTFV